LGRNENIIQNIPFALFADESCVAETDVEMLEAITKYQANKMQRHNACAPE
jgi:hypothetical protein